MKRVATIAQPHNTGISTQSWEFCRHLSPSKVLITDLTDLHALAGKKVKSYFSRFDGLNTRVCRGIPSYADAQWLLDDVDVLFIIETPLNHDIYIMAKEKGVETILQSNYELIDRLSPQYAHLPIADKLWAPSDWYWDELKMKTDEWGVKLKRVDVPVNRVILPFTPRTKARKFLFIAGYPTHEDRNGLQLLLDSLPMIKNQGIQITIRAQYALPEIDDDRVRVYTKEARDYWDVYGDADVLLLPRRYGGLSLPLSEAMSKGIVPVMLDCSPQTGRLPQDWLVPAHFQKRITTRPEIDIYECTPEDLAAKIDYVASLSEFTFSSWSLRADSLAHEIDWAVQKTIYEALLQGEEAPEPQMPQEYLMWT